MERTTVRHKYLFIAVKPEYANKLISGEKDIELRKMRPHVHQGDFVIIYASAPLKAVLGFGIVKNVIESNPQKMWADYSKRLGIDEKDFYSYYDGCDKAVGIEIERIRAIANPIGLDELKRVDPNFHPPQIYRYVTNEVMHKVLLKNEF